MQAILICDPGPLAQRIRSALGDAGYDCPESSVVSAHDARRMLTAAPALVVIALSPEPERGLAALEKYPFAGACPVLVVGPTGDSRMVLRALRAGAADFVDEKDPEGDLAMALQRLRGVGDRQSEPARTIAVLAPSGGSGASTLAVNLATVYAGHSKTALLIDLKLHNGDLSALLDVRPAHNLAELCQSVGQMDRSMFERSLTQHASGVHLLAPPRAYPDAQLVSAEGVRQVLNLARTVFPYVVIDADNSFAPEQIQALRQSDLVVVVLRLDFASLRNTKRALDYLEQLGIGRDKVRVVVNRYGQAREVPADKAEEALGVKIAHYVPEDAKTVNRANNNGVPVVKESPSARVAKSLTTLATSVNGRKHS
jgi:pilus assembly protein CpaE